MTRIRVFLTIEAFAFVIAALTHFGYLFPGYAHRQASIAESVIVVVLVSGLLVSIVQPALTRTAGLIAQSFALLLTLVGIFTIIVGVGPRTASDVVYHVVIVIVLAVGVRVALRTSTTRTA
jgi:hypothetical protein